MSNAAFVVLYFLFQLLEIVSRRY